MTPIKIELSLAVDPDMLDKVGPKDDPGLCQRVTFILDNGYIVSMSRGEFNRLIAHPDEGVAVAGLFGITGQ